MGAGKGKMRRRQATGTAGTPRGWSTKSRVRDYQVGDRCIFVNKKRGKEFAYLDGEVGEIITHRLDDVLPFRKAGSRAIGPHEGRYQLQMADGKILNFVTLDELGDCWGRTDEAGRLRRPRFRVGDSAVFAYDPKDFSWMARNEETILAYGLEVDAPKMAALHGQTVRVVEVTKSGVGDAAQTTPKDGNFVYRIESEDGNDYYSCWYIEGHHLLSLLDSKEPFEIDVDSLRF